MSASFASQSHASNPSTDPGGSSPETEDVREGGDEVVVEESEGSGDEPVSDDASFSEDQPASGGSQSASGEDPNAERISDLESQLSERDALIGQIADEMDRNPELRAMLSGQRSASSSEPSDWGVKLERDLRGVLKPEAAEALTKAFSPYIKKLQEATDEVTRLRSTAQSLSRTVGSREYVRALGDAGVAPEVQQTQPFQKFLKGLRLNRTYQSIEARDPIFAAETAAARWQAARAQKLGWKDDRARIETAKNSRGAQGSQRSASLADKVIEITRSPDGSHVDEAQRVRFEYAQKGKELPNIRYVNK